MTVGLIKNLAVDLVEDLTVGLMGGLTVALVGSLASVSPDRETLLHDSFAFGLGLS